MRRPTPRQVETAQKATRLLFEACARLRMQVRANHRGPRFLELRGAFGEGVRAGASRQADVRNLARQIIKGAGLHRQALARVKNGSALLRRIQQLLQRLVDLEQARQEPRT